MNTKNLNRKLKGYTKTSLRAGNEDSAVVDVIDDLQSITGDDDHSIDTSHDTSDVVDAEYAPNPAIVTEMMTEINEAPEITNADTAFKLLSDSNEALRRLDIIHMNVNYPVSGYRANNATILAAEPGLESLVPNASLSKRRLSQALENTKVQIVKAAFNAFIKWLKEKVNNGIAKLRSLFQSKPTPATAAEIKTVAEASNSSEMVKAPKESNVAPVNTGSTKTQQLALGYDKTEPVQSRVRKTKPEKQLADDTAIELNSQLEEVPLRIFVRSTFDKRIWMQAGHWTRHMVSDTAKATEMLGLIKDLSTGVETFLNNSTALYFGIKTKPEDVETLVGRYMTSNDSYIKTLNAYLEIEGLFIRQDTPAPPVMTDFLANAQKLLIHEKTLGIERFIKTNKTSNDVFEAMMTFSKESEVVMSDAAAQKALEQARKTLLSLGRVYGTLPFTVDAMSKLHLSIKKIAAEINGVYRL